MVIEVSLKRFILDLFILSTPLPWIQLSVHSFISDLVPPEHAKLSSVYSYLCTD
ncbi:unknown [Methanothermobacter thermautotrophicus str. Delta H]|uniref:Uncharacterized protein n=1 Tax=Methanothermobacter thermautotrophicus (strain ATCC 29096 / DSM 1053 / JCM 10044 / NBRC 100330 / Delta H) TaxID=187420 RepID=O27799_METTH|nr:unknown [Methanothermobacter thermautotrophicus str. Delta H]